MITIANVITPTSMMLACAYRTAQGVLIACDKSQLFSSDDDGEDDDDDDADDDWETNRDQCWFQASAQPY